MVDKWVDIAILILRTGHSTVPPTYTCPSTHNHTQQVKVAVRQIQMPDYRTGKQDKEKSKFHLVIAP